MNEEIQNLVNQLNAASDAYYNGREELMTDYEWDAAFDKLKKLEEEVETLKNNITTNLADIKAVAEKLKD